MEWKGLGNFQHTQRKSFQSSPLWEDLISTSSFYTLTRMLLVLVLFLANLMRKARNMLSPMHPKATRLRAITLHTKGNVLLLYGSSYISGPIFMAPSSFCISSGWWPTTSLLVSLFVWHLYFRSMSSRLFTDLVLHVKTWIPCHENP